MTNIKRRIGALEAVRRPAPQKVDMRAAFDAVEKRLRALGIKPLSGDRGAVVARKVAEFFGRHE